MNDPSVSRTAVTAAAPPIGLAALTLSGAERTALARQGFVTAESRRYGLPIYKLRFRLEGRQVVRYLGTDPATAEIVRRELTQLQAPTRAGRTVRRLTRAAGRELRDVRQSLRPALERAGFRFHGAAIRRVGGNAPAIGANPPAGAFPANP